MPQPRIQVLVCTNERAPDANRPCCAHHGGLAVYRRFKDAVRLLGLRESVLITRTGCLRHCSHGVVVAVWPENIWLGGLSVEADLEAVLARLAGAGAADDSRAMDDLGCVRIEDQPWE